jgi:hypothetical protein
VHSRPKIAQAKAPFTLLGWGVFFLAKKGTNPQRAEPQGKKIELRLLSASPAMGPSAPFICKSSVSRKVSKINLGHTN